MFRACKILGQVRALLPRLHELLEVRQVVEQLGTPDKVVLRDVIQLVVGEGDLKENLSSHAGILHEFA